MATVLLPHVRQDIRANRRLHFALFQALKKATYKPDAFFKARIRRQILGSRSNLAFPRTLRGAKMAVVQCSNATGWAMVAVMLGSWWVRVRSCQGASLVYKPDTNGAVTHAMSRA